MPATFRAAPTYRASQSGIPIYADTRQITALAKSLRAASPEAAAALRKSLRMAGEIVAEDARQRVSYSSRIEYSIKVRTGGPKVIRVVAGGDSAPDAAPIENKGKGFVRHPVFAKKGTSRAQWTWTNKGSHPAYLAPALDAHRDEVTRLIEEAVTGAVVGAISGRFGRA